MKSFLPIQGGKINTDLKQNPLDDSDYIMSLVTDFQIQPTITDLLQEYYSCIQTLLNIEGLKYEYPLLNIKYVSGDIKHPVYSEEITINSDFWGELTLFRNSQFTALEYKQAKTITTLLTSPLHSKIMQKCGDFVSDGENIIGLAKPQLIEQLIIREAKIALREKKPISLILLDIDRFDPIIKLSGKLHSDNILYKVMQNIHTALRETDLLIRFNKDSFYIILRDASGENAIKISERIRQKIDRTSFYNLNDKPLHITMSAGIVELSSSDSLDIIIKRSKGALRLARINGRNQSHLLDDLSVVA